jgi:2-polyprenyl-3-methyl-5-hydroxy-6-metoxy-1,4-benzoquinol methylase
VCPGCEDERRHTKLWDANARAWTRLSRAGFDVYRDLINTLAFFAMLPPVSGLIGLDLGCGEGHNTRLLAATGADVVALDLSEYFMETAAARAGAASDSSLATAHTSHCQARRLTSPPHS